MSQPPQPPYSGQPYPEQPTSGQPSSGQPWSGQPSSGQPYSGQPNPDVPTSVPPQPGFPAYGQPPVYPPPSEPQYGQSGYGQPGYDQTQFGPPQPQFGQPGYGQPGYGQPGYGQPGYGQPGAFPPEPPKKSKALPIVLISVAVFLVLCLGGGTAIYLAARNTAKDVNTALNSPNPTPPASDEANPDPTAPAADNAKYTVVEPKTLGGRPKLTDKQFASLASGLKSSLGEVPGAGNTVGALYGAPENKNIVVVAAAAAPILEPEKELDGMFSGAGFGGIKISGIVDVSPGALGGVAKCGRAVDGSLTMSICIWTDNGSLGMMMFFNQSMTKAKAEFGKLRSQVEKKSS